MTAYEYEKEKLLCSRNGTTVVATYRNSLSKSPDDIARDAIDINYVFAKQHYDENMTFLNLLLEGEVRDTIVFSWAMGNVDEPESNGRTILIGGH